MRIRIFDTLSEDFRVLSDRKINMFVCGPTVYDYAHIGHARTYIFFDFFAKYLRQIGFEINYLQNITDIDDKIIARARRDKKTPIKLADSFFREYVRDMKSLGVSAVDTYAKATAFIPQIAKQVERLCNNGYAYKIENDGYYFDISKFSDYGKLSKRTAGQADDAISRIDESVKKMHRGDFALWKSANIEPKTKKSFITIDGEPLWKTSLGWGRPGWHIEDTAITEHYFGPQYDIHGGGIDLKFPHHEAEIAQQEAASGKKPFVKTWMHTGFLTIDGKKMSKSLGNFITVKSFLENDDAAVLRIMIFQHHYRSPMDYTEKLLESARNTWSNIKIFMNKLDFFISRRKYNDGKINDTYLQNSKLIDGALSDDMNTPMALSLIFNAINHYDEMMSVTKYKDLLNARDFISKNLSLFGILPPKSKIPQKIQNLFKKREKLREEALKNKKKNESRSRQQFIQSDALRKKINELGYAIEDTSEFGAFISPK
ncbi:MAG: cysteine--tRNA ligase [Patescibacteria group bacterium]